MKKVQLLITFFLSLFIFQINGQENIFKFALSGSDANLQFAKSDSLGFTYLAGTFYNNFVFQGSILTNDQGEKDPQVFMMKALPNGRLAYLEPILNPNNVGSINLNDIAINDRGEAAILLSVYGAPSIRIANRTVPLSSNEDVLLIAKISKTGFVKWIRVIRSIGGNSTIVSRDLEMDEEGNVFITGFFEADEAIFGTNILPGLSTEPQMFLAKYTYDGLVDWASSCQVVENADTTGGITAYKLKLSADSKVYVAGELTGYRDFKFQASVVSNQGASNAYLACFHSTGDVNWAREFVGDGEIVPGDFGFDEDDNVVYTCFYKSDVFNLETINLSNPSDYDLAIVKYSPNGETVWESNLPTDLVFLRTWQSDVNVFKGDSSDITLWGNSFKEGVNQFYAMQLDNETGGVEWSKTSTNTVDVFVDQVITDNQNNLYYLGSTYSDLDFNGNTISDFTGYGVNYLCKVGDDGSTKFFTNYQNKIDGSAFFQKMGTDNFGNLLVFGTFWGDSAQVGPIKLVTDTIKSGIFISKYAGLAKLSGEIINFSGDPVSGGYIKLLGYAYLQKCIVSDSVPIRDDGKYVFNDVPLGNYIMHAFPGTTEGVDYHPIYFPSAAHWEDARRIEVKAPVEYSNLFIYAPEVVPPIGTSSITGKLTEVDGDDLFKSTQSKPRPNARASLAKSKKKSDYEIIASTITDENGDFHFEDISPGDYVVLIEEPGLPNVTVHSIFVIGDSYISNVNYYMDEETIEAVDDPYSEQSNVDETSAEQSFIVYPNPSDGILNVMVIGNGEISSVKVTAIDGQEVKYLNNLDASSVQFNLIPGIYLVHIIGTKEQIMRKVVIR